MRISCMINRKNQLVNRRQDYTDACKNNAREEQGIK